MSATSIDSDKSDKSDKSSQNDQTMKIQLGDILKITSPANDIYNDQTFIIDYIDKSKMVVINATTMEVNVINIAADGTIVDKTITGMNLIYRNKYPGYARQNNLMPGTWINVYFGGDIPATITGLITNLEEDMIEIRTYPENETIYINFNYSGIPENLPIELIEIRDKPERKSASAEASQTPEPEHREEIADLADVEERTELDVDVKEGSEDTEKDMETDDTISIPTQQVREHLHRMLLEADDIIFGMGEDLAPVEDRVEKKSSNIQYSIEAQCNDLLDEMLSTIPDSERTRKVLKNIHTMIERFKQLRSRFSIKDEHENVIGVLKHESTWKPLTEELMNFNHNLYWILPVVKYVKKVYDITGDFEDMPQDIVPLESIATFKNLQQQLEMYKSNNFPDEQNKYTYLANLIHNEHEPFQDINPENAKDVIYTQKVGANLQAIVNNLDRLYSDVVHNGIITSRRFVIQRYNLGEKTINASKVDKKSMTYTLSNITPPDTLSLDSVMTLQEPVLRFSRINLHSTSILERSNLSNSFLNYWELLKTFTKVRVVNTNNYVLDESQFLNKVTQYIMDQTDVTEELDGYTGDEKYKNMVNKIVPATKQLFGITSKYLSGKLSFVDAVNYMEPFLVYTDDLTFKQFEYMAEVIRKEISTQIKLYVTRGQAFFKLTSIKSKVAFNPSAESVYNALGKLSNDVFNNGYGYTNAVRLTNSELLGRILSRDAGRLYNSSIALENIPLMFPENIAHLFDDASTLNKQMLEEYKEKDDCKTYTLAKQYTSVEELHADDKRDIYYDNKFDKTMYSILDDNKMQKEIATRAPDDFVMFLIKELEKKEKLDTNDATYLAETLIAGMKKVKEGDYAFIFNITTANDNEPSIDYYKRVNGEWMLDNGVDKSYFVNDDASLCNLQEKCIQQKDKCETTNLNKSQLEQSALKSILAEFDTKYLASKERMEGKIKYDVEYNNDVIGKLAQIQIHDMFKYDTKQSTIGKMINADNMLNKVVSPYYGGLQKILGQGDFTKKQHDIVRFCMQFTREAIRDSDENKGWRYCIKTSTELIPEFRFTLAVAFINSPASYLGVVEELKATIGKISDDGNAWVDEHSGQVIVVDNFVTEDTYVDGFKDVSRGLLERDASEAMAGKLVKSVHQTHEMKVCNNIIDTLSNVMGVNVEDYKGFIADLVIRIFNAKIPSEQNYNVAVREASKNKKTLPTFNELYNTLILYLTMGVFLVSVQTSIPPVKTKRTFPGCVTSFHGYPFDANGDDSAITYVACVAYHVRNSSEPWNVLLKKTQKTIVTKLKSTIQDNLLDHADYIRKANEKAHYLLTTPPENIPDELNVASIWIHFLPPLVNFNITKLHPLTTEFKAKMLQDLKSGYAGQRDDLLVVQSKIIYYSLALQEKIQKVVTQQAPLLRNAASDPFVENACCNTDSNASTTIGYFTERESDIRVYNDMVMRLSHILRDVNMITRGGLFYSPLNTKTMYPPLKNEFSEQTIYQTFVVYCRFNSILPIPTYLEKFCEEKPRNVKAGESIREIIQKLQHDGRIYTNESLIRLFQAVSRENIVNSLQNEAPNIDYIYGLRNLLERDTDAAESTSEYYEFSDKFKTMLSSNLDTFDISQYDTKMIREFKNYLAEENEAMKRDILNFLNENITIKTSRSKLEELMTDILSFEENRPYAEPSISDTDGYNYIHSLKTFVHNMVKVYPTMILNEVDYTNTSIPSYWKLSDTHKMNLKKIIRTETEPLRNFYSNNMINSILEAIQTKGADIERIMKTTPYFTKIQYKGTITDNIFDQRVATLLTEYYVLLVLSLYMQLTEAPQMIYVEKEETNILEDSFTSEGLEDSQRNVEIGEQKQQTELLLEGNKKSLRTNIANLLYTYMHVEKATIDLVKMPYESVMDKVFRHVVAEKELFLSKGPKTEDEKMLYNVFKGHKLGDMGKGLRKGHLAYDADVYDEESEVMKSLEQTYEQDVRQLSHNPNVQARNIDQFLEDHLQEQRETEEIEGEVYDMSRMTSDYYDGTFDGEEVDDYDIYN